MYSKRNEAQGLDQVAGLRVRRSQRMGAVPVAAASVLFM